MKDCRTYELLSEFSLLTDDFEFLVLKSDIEIVAVVYRPPAGDIVKFLNLFESFLEYICASEFRLVCGGYFNLNILEDTPRACDFMCQAFIQLVSQM